MTILPSPIPHPLDHCPFDVPGWAYDALEWVVGFDWPEGDEKATWDVADRWYAIADRLTAPRDEAFDAAGRVIAGYGGAGVTAQAFIGAWDRVAVEDRAPLTSLLEIADELGKLVEECGCDIEGAKLEAWIEIGLFLTELIGMAVATAVTLGAASPAAGGLIAATRFTIQRIFQRLAEQLGQKAIKKTLKEAGERAAKQLTTRDGLKKLGREALGEGLDEMREEAATNAGIQLYQNSTGRSDGLDWKDLGTSAAGGFAAGAAASGAGVGKGSHTGVVRGMGAEVLGEFGGAAVSGDLPDLEGVAKAASSGASGALAAGVTDVSMSGLDVPALDTGDPPDLSIASSSSPDHGATPLPSEPGGSPWATPSPARQSTQDPQDASLAGLGNSQQQGPVYYSSAYAGRGPEPPPPPEPERQPGPDPAPPPKPARPEPRIPAPRRPVDHVAEALPPEPFQPVEPRPPRDGGLPLDPRDFLAHDHSTHEQNPRDEYADHLTRHRGQAAEAPAPPRIEVDPPDWVRRNDDVGTPARAGVETGDESALTGDDDPPPIDRSRPYGKRGGLRPPLAVHQNDLERAMPRQADGRVHRLADPREGTWFALANDGGPAADPTRAINCVDGVLSLFDTYIHGRPRVAAPRTFDAYAEGEPTRPLGAEEAGLARIEETVGGEFQGLCPYVGSLPAEQAKSAVDQAMTNLHNHVYNAGHGAFAFVVTEAEQGTAHAWTAVNQNGTVLFLDPQTGGLSEGMPLYGHLGIPAPDNIVSMDALVVDNTGKPSPLPWHEAGLWSRSTLEPTGVEDKPPGHETEAQAAERRILTTLTADQRAALEASVREAQEVAELELTAMHTLAAAVDGEVVDEEYRVKTLASLARKFVQRQARKPTGVDRFLQDSNDRVRFSVKLPESGYAERLSRALTTLQSDGYQVVAVASFWGDGKGRHNGLNVTLDNPAGFRMEMQFPTRKSWEVGKLTHDLDEIVRLDSKEITDIERAEAFLAILAVNKMHDMAAHQPTGITLDNVAPVDTSLARWVTRVAGEKAWIAYRTAVASDGMTLREALEQWALAPDDLPGTEGLDAADERTDLRLPGVSGGPRVEGGDESDRIPDPADAPQSGDLARLQKGMDVRPRAGGWTPVRRFIRERVDGSRPRNSGAAGTGAPADGTADNAGAGSDVRRGREDGLGLRPAAGVTPSSVEASVQEVETIAKTAFASDPVPEPSSLTIARAAVVDRVSPHSPAFARIVVQLLAEHATTEHKLNATAALLDPVRRDRALQLLAELAQGAVMADYFSLADFLRLNPGAGTLFEPVRKDGRDRKQAFVAAARQRDPVRTIGPGPTVAQRALLNAYGVTLSRRVLPAAHGEISALADELEVELGADVHVSARAKKPADLLDKIRRMASDRRGRPARSDYRLGDVLDAVGVRLTVPDMRSLEAVLRGTIERFGTGDGGRILEIENMYAEPKPQAPAYRVIPLIVAIEIDGMPYTYELQLTTERASIAADIEHNTIYKPYVQLDAAQEQLVRDAMAEAAALDQLETVERNADE